MIRVIQWATGQIGQIAIRAMAKDPRFEIVGAYVTSDAKHGKDVGTLAGIAPLGVLATKSAGEILRMNADCVLYAPLRPSLDEICTILRSGKNVVTAVGYVYPKALGAEVVNKIEAACKEGKSSLHGTGIHPGFSGDLLPLVMSRMSQSIDRIVVKEIADLRKHPSRGIVFDAFDFGRPVEEARAKPDEWGEIVGKIFRESQAMLADAIGVVPDRHTKNYEYAAAQERAEIACGVIEKGTVGGRFFEWTSWVGETPKITFQTYWRVVDSMTPDWGVRSEGFVNVRYEVIVEGSPSLRASFLPSATKLDGTPAVDDPGAVGRICTAMNCVSSIPMVVHARPGIFTHLDMA